MKKTFYLTFRVKALISGCLSFMLGVSTVLLIFTSRPAEAVSADTIAADEPVIIIDAGHGGEDGGTQSSSGVLEKDINLQISIKLNSLLKSMGYKTVMIRSDDSLIYDEGAQKMRDKKVSDINNRLDIAESYPDSLFISVHQNYFTQSKYSGAQVFYSPNNPESRSLAQNIQSSIIGSIQNENTRKIKKSGSEIYLLYNIKSPAVMVECGFMSNPSEALLLCDDEYQKKMALAIVSGITDYLSAS